jgi:hypothetical protein
MSSHYDLYQILIKLDPDEHAAFVRAPYFILEACMEYGDHTLLASIEDAEDAGEYRLHIGLPDRPDMRSALIFPDLAEAVATLKAIKCSFPNVRLWLSTLQIQAEIEGDSIWPGLVNARASMEPSDTDCPWVQLAADFAAGRVTHATYGGNEWHESYWMYDAVARRI